MTTFFSVTEIVVYLPERTNTGLLTGSDQTVGYGPCVAAIIGYEF